ncbi:MAG TPA: hypothetical protein VF391_13995, partial [Dermatophilaceae bacterium]
MLITTDPLADNARSTAGSSNQPQSDHQVLSAAEPEPGAGSVREVPRPRQVHRHAGLTGGRDDDVVT